MTFSSQLTTRCLCLAFLLLLAMEQGKSASSDMMTVVFPPLTEIQVKSLIVFCTVLNETYTATVIDNKTSINFPVSLSNYGTFRRLMTSSYRETSFSVFPLALGFHVFAKWGIAIANTDAISVFTDDMLDTEYVVSTWTDCCNATAFILISALDVSSTTVSITLPDSFSSTVTADGQDYTTDFTLQLNLREVITLTSTFDLSGTKVTGSDAILVQSGSNAAAVQGTKEGQLIETLPPLVNQGTEYFGVPTTGRASHVYRLVASTSSNTVTIKEDAGSVVTVILTSSNPVYDYVASNPVIITSSDALLVTQYSSSYDSSNIPPAMTFLPSSAHWASYYVIKEVDGSLTRPEYVSVVILTSYTSGVRMTYNDQTQSSVTGWSTFQSDATFSYVTLPVPQTFLLDHDSGQTFMVLQYGVDTNWAYSFVPVFTRSPVTTTTSTTSTSTTTSATTTSGTVAASGSSQGSSSVTASSNEMDSSPSSWLEDTTNKVMLGMGVSAAIVVVATVVIWRVFMVPAEAALTSTATIKALESSLATDVISSSAPPVSNELPPAERMGLTKVET